MSELEPSVADLPIEARKGVETLQDKITFAQEELKKEQARLLKKIERAEAAFEKAQTDLARQAAFGAFDVVAPNEGEVTYAEYLASRPAEPTEGIVRVSGNYFKDAATGKRVRGDLYREQQERVSESQTQAHYDRVIEKQALEGKSLMYLAREAAKARQEGNTAYEEDIRTLAAKQVSEIIHSNEGGDLEARQQEEMAHFDQLVEEIPARLEKLAERRAAHADERVDDAHAKPTGEGHPSQRKVKAEAESVSKAKIETYLGDELVEVQNSFESTNGETVVEIKGADGTTRFVRKNELTEKEVDASTQDIQSEAGRKLSSKGQDDEAESTNEDDAPTDESKVKADKKDKSEKKQKKSKEISPQETNSDAKDSVEKATKKKPFIPGNFHGTKRVQLINSEQVGDEPGTVTVRDEDGNEYDIPRTELLYLKEEPKVPGKELELYTGPRESEPGDKAGPSSIGANGELSDSDNLFKVDSKGVVTAPESSQHTEFGVLAPYVVEVEQKDRKAAIKQWWQSFGASVREKAGTAYWANRWTSRRDKRLERGVDATASESEQQDRRSGNRYALVAAGIGGALLVLSLAGASVLATNEEEKSVTNIDLGEHLEWTQQNPGMGHPLPGESPSPEPTSGVEQLPLTDLEGGGTQEISQ